MLCLKSYRLYSKKQRFCLFKEGYILKLMDGLTYLSCQYIHPIMIFDAKYIFIHSGFFSGMSWRFYAKSWHFSNPQWNILARFLLVYIHLHLWKKLRKWLHNILAELRRPEGPSSGAPYSYGKEKETHQWVFSWLSWLAVLLVGAYARRRRRRRRRSRAKWRPYSKY